MTQSKKSLQSGMSCGMWTIKGLEISMIVFIHYLISPETSLKTGFEKPLHCNRLSRFRWTGAVKALFWISVSFLISSLLSMLG